MAIRHGITFLAAMLLAAVLGAPEPAVAQQKLRELPTRDVEQADSPLETFKNFERAWNRGDAARIAASIGEGRAYIDVRGMGRRGGWFSRPQVLFLFRNMFGTNTQTKFEFVTYHNLDKPDRKIFGIAYRSYRNNHSGRVVSDKVYVTLDREGSAWVVAEIKTTR